MSDYRFGVSPVNYPDPYPDLIAVRYGANNFESSVVVQELELAMKRALYGLL